MRREQILDYPDIAMHGLRSMFGSGSRVLEVGILREMGRAFELPATVDNLAEAVKFARAHKGALRQSTFTGSRF
jgi:hypothetical protein